METNDLKAASKVILENGWHAELMDNKKGNTRMALVHALTHDEAGSIYAHQIIKYLNRETQQYEFVNHTPSQLKLKATLKGIGF